MGAFSKCSGGRPDHRKKGRCRDDDDDDDCKRRRHHHRHHPRHRRSCG